MHVETLGSGPRVVLVHGSVTGVQTWRAQRALAGRRRLELVSRPGFLPGPPVDRVDFERDAALLARHLAAGPRAHLVGHSYGGVVSLLAAAAAPGSVRSLTVIEPPALGVARGDPAVEAFAAAAGEHWRDGPADPRAFVARFLELVGSSVRLPDPLPPELERGARMLQVERLSTEAVIPLAQLAAAPFPKLVVSGAHHPAFDAVCDVLERELGAERAVVPGAGHAAQRAPGFDGVLVDFLERAERPV